MHVACRTQVVPVVLGALDTVHASIARWLDIISGHHNLWHLQKAVLLGSARILRKVMSSPEWLPLHGLGVQSPVTTVNYETCSFSCFSSFVHETKTRFCRWGNCGLANSPLIMTFSA